MVRMYLEWFKGVYSVNIEFLGVVMREEFETWFVKNYSELFHKGGKPLEKDISGIYTDRGTLGMWIVWCYKTEETVEIKSKIKQFLIEKGLYE